MVERGPLGSLIEELTFDDVLHPLLTDDHVRAINRRLAVLILNGKYISKANNNSPLLNNFRSLCRPLNCVPKPNHGQVSSFQADGSRVVTFLFHHFQKPSLTITIIISPLWLGIQVQCSLSYSPFLFFVCVSREQRKEGRKEGRKKRNADCVVTTFQYIIFMYLCIYTFRPFVCPCEESIFYFAHGCTHFSI